MKIIWLGHGSFRIEIEQAVLLIDPWLNGNPAFPNEKRSQAIAGVTHILLTHGHGDHASEVVDLSRELGVPVAGIHELAVWLTHQGAKSIGFGKGGTIDCGGALVTMVNASHSASIDFGGQTLPAGSAAGFMIAGEGRVIYMSGDTDIMADMAWMGEYHQPDIGILSCGGHYTMDMARAAWAANKYFNFKQVIPAHYKTFPILAQNADVLREKLDPKVELLTPEVMDVIEL